MCLLLMIYEINHFFFMCLFLDETEAKGPHFFFFETGSPLSQRLDDKHPLPPPPSPLPPLPSNPLL